MPAYVIIRTSFPRTRGISPPIQSGKSPIFLATPHFRRCGILGGCVLPRRGAAVLIPTPRRSRTHQPRLRLPNLT